MSVLNWVKRSAAWPRWAKSLALAAVLHGGMTAGALAQETYASGVSPALAEALQDIGYRRPRHAMRLWGNECESCDDGSNWSPSYPSYPSQPTPAPMPNERAPSSPPSNVVPPTAPPTAPPAPSQPEFNYTPSPNQTASSGGVNPNMLGDSPFGGCVLFDAGVFAVDIAHPRFACSRANLAENNSAIPTDRVFASYRRYAGATKVEVFNNVDFGGAIGVFDGSSMLDLDHVSFGFERTMFCEQMSFEVRLPFTYQIASDIQINADRFSPDFLSGIPITARDFELGDVNIIFKSILRQNCNFTLSGGVGLNLPTARDVRTDIRVNTTGNLFGGLPPMTTANLRIGALFGNEIVNLTPYLAAAWTPNDCTFHQGFAQIDTPLNDANVRYTIHGYVNNAFTGNMNLPIDPQHSLFDLEMSQQTIARLNYQFGRWLYRDDEACRLRGVAGLLELHYTTTLNNARGNQIQIDPTQSMANRNFVDALRGNPNDNDPFVLFSVKNPANRIDILNIAVGALVRYGKTDIQGGYVIPLRKGDDKPFDGEMHILVNRTF